MRHLDTNCAHNQRGIDERKGFENIVLGGSLLATSSLAIVSPPLQNTVVPSGLSVVFMHERSGNDNGTSLASVPNRGDIGIFRRCLALDVFLSL